MTWIDIAMQVFIGLFILYLIFMVSNWLDTVYTAAKDISAIRKIMESK